jgi:phospholipid/cholesterol/gamma-HCH transport system ATP-binding protein
MIQFTNVALTLGNRRVLKDISFDVMPGEIRAILGGSGSGKTTLLRLALGLLKADQGTVSVAGQDITRMPEKDLFEIRQKMAMVFQYSALFDSLTVRENVGYRLWEQGKRSDEEIDQKVLESLKFVGMEDTANKMPAELSGGMRKRVGIARALASGAKLLLYDEPTAGLDPVNTHMIARLILRLKATGFTQVVVTHDLDTAYRVADRVVLLLKGKVAFDGTPDELKSSDDPAIKAFLDPSSIESEWSPIPQEDGVSEETVGHSTAPRRSGS